MLDSVQAMPHVGAERSMRTAHHDWADAAERTQHTVRNLSDQLRRFLEDQTWIENRRVMDLIRATEAAALQVRDDAPRGTDVGLEIDTPGLTISLPFERPLYDPQPDIAIRSLPTPQPVELDSLDALFTQRFIDTARLAGNIRAVVPPRRSAALDEIVALYPLEEGVAEILGYLSLSGDDLEIVVDLERDEMVFEHTDGDGHSRRVRMPHVTVTRTEAG